MAQKEFALRLDANEYIPPSKAQLRRFQAAQAAQVAQAVQRHQSKQLAQSKELRSEAKVFIPSASKSRHTNQYNQSYEVLTSMHPKYYNFVSTVINCTPHAIIYYAHHSPAITIDKVGDSFINNFRPEVSEQLQDIPEFPDINIYNSSSYRPIRDQPEKSKFLNEFMGWFGDRLVTLIMSPISAKNIAHALKSGDVVSPPNLIILSPNSSNTVRSSEGNIIGVTAFTILWYKGEEVGRNML